MDDTQKQQSSTPNLQDQKPQENTVFQFVKPVPVPGPTDDATQQSSTDDTQSQQPVSVPVGRTEGEPTPIKPDIIKWVEASEPHEVELAPELVEAGVQAPQEEKLDLDEEDKNAGVDYASPIIPVNVDPLISRIKLPMTEEEAKKVMAHPNPSSSLYWLAMTMLRQIAWFKHNPLEKQV